MVSERRTEDGGTVAVYSDITELKQREQDLTEKSNSLRYPRNSPNTWRRRCTTRSSPVSKTSR